MNIDFKELERRIGRLKELEKQLADMDIEGFEEEANSIKLKLKNPQALKEVESGMKDLVKIIKQRNTQKMNEAASARAMKEKEQLRLKKEMEDLERRITRLKVLENHLDNMNVEGFELTANSIRTKLKDPKAVEKIEEELRILADKIKQRDIWQTKGASLLEAAMKKNKDGIALFNNQEYLKALPLFESALTDLVKSQSHVFDDDNLLRSIKENILSCQRNMIACNLTEGINRFDIGQDLLKERKWQRASEELKAAIDYLSKAGGMSAEIKEDKKRLHAEKLINSTNNLIEHCLIEQDTERAEKKLSDVKKLLDEVITDRDQKNFVTATEKLVKTEALINEPVVFAQKKNFAQFNQSLKQIVVDAGQVKRSIVEMEERESKLKVLQTRLNTLKFEGYEEEVAGLMAKTKETKDFDQVWQELISLEDKIKQRNLWKSTGAGIFESALDSCKKASQAFYSKEYEKALALFGEGITKFINAKDYAQYDNHLMTSINENINAARKNVLASNLGLGAKKSEIAQDRFNQENYDQAIVEFNSAYAYFLAARELASELKDSAKTASAEKLINITNNNISDCQVALDKYKISQMIMTVNQMIEESQTYEIRKDYKDAKQKLVDADRIYRDALEIGRQRGFKEEITRIEEMMSAIKFKISGIGKEQLPKIEEVQIQIDIDDSDS